MSIEKNSVKKEKGNRRAGADKIMDFIAKIACLAVAFFIWFYAMSTDVITLEREFTVPVNFEKETSLLENTGWSVLSGKDSRIVVTLKGKRNIINHVTEGDIYAFVDLSDVTSPGRQMLEVKFSLPGECELVGTSVSSISPYVDKRVTQNIPVNVVYADYVIKSDYQLDEPSFDVKEISVTGPESELRRIAAARADLVLGEITETKDVVTQLKLVNAAGEVVESNYVSTSTNSIKVSVKLYALKDVPLTVGYKYGYFNSENVKITITPAMVTLRGEPSVLEKIDNIQLATLDEKKFAVNSTQNVPINVSGNGLINVSSATTAVINVEHINTGTKQLVISNISLSNSGGLDCELQTESLNITLRGPYDLLSKITEENVTVTADMKNYSSGGGITVVPATVKLSSEFEALVYEIDSYNVTVNLK